jgi:hypothetical protein
MYKNYKTKSAKSTAKKSTGSSYTITSVCDNIYKLSNGVYRARKTMDGVKYSRNFRNLAKAKAWLKSL